MEWEIDGPFSVIREKLSCMFLTVCYGPCAMGIPRLVQRWVGPATSPTVIHECRECGKTVDSGKESCPSCESTGISRYEIR